jgi:transposase
MLGRSARNDRRMLNGIFWVLRSGAPWRDLPKNYRPRAIKQCRRVATRYDKLTAN